ncbi:MAG: AIR synthase related protein, partial [Myxococcota bacterium]|nr:AIR synthase related protein [Myxococcota bacterium]
MTEDDITKFLTSALIKAPKRYGAGDDCAVVEAGVIVTQDTMIQDVHFDHRLSASDVGWKLVAVNASDIAAMGRMPSWATLSISLPKDISPEWLEGFREGLLEACRT